MARSIIRLTARDFHAWMPIMEGFVDIEKAAGSCGVQVFQSADLPNDAVMIVHWDDRDAPRKFLGSPALVAVMQKAGVLEASETPFGETVLNSEHEELWREFGPGLRSKR